MRPELGDLPREQVEDVVAELGLQDWVAGLPDGLSTRLGPGGVTLSAGEEQLLAFARLLAREAGYEFQQLSAVFSGVACESLSASSAGSSGSAGRPSTAR